MGPLRRSFRLPRRTRRQIDAEVSEEIGFHLAERAAQLARLGHAPDDARELAARRFGDLERTRDALRDSTLRREGRMRRRDVMERLWQDVRYTLRQLRREPGFAAVAILTLAVGIAANAVMFGVVDRLLLRPPAHVVEPERVGRLYLGVTEPSGERDERAGTSYYRMRQLQEAARGVAQVAGIATGRQVIVGVGDDAEQVEGAYATADLFRMLGVRPHLGRFFTEAEDVPPTGERVVVIGHGLWRRRFGADPGVLGRTLRIGAAEYEIVGVAPPGFGGLDASEMDVWRPTTAAATAIGIDGWATTHDWHWIEVVARLEDGVTRERAEAVLGAAHARSVLDELERDRATPRGRGGRAPAAAAAAPTPSARVAAMRPTVTVAPVQRERGPGQSASTRVSVWLTGVAGAVLLIACANVANLLLARGARRRREIAVRLALGISRARLVGQLVFESLALALAGAVVGLVLSYWGAEAVRAVLLSDSAEVPVLDLRVLAFTVAAATLAGLLAGLAPALQAIRPDLSAALRAGSRDGGGRRAPLRTALLVTQAALSVMLLVGAGLFVRSLREAQATSLGFEPERVVMMTLSYRGSEPEGRAARDALDARIVERMRAVPGVERVTTAQALPNYRTMSRDLATEARDSVPGAGDMLLNAVGTDFFEAIGARLARGRTFDARDVLGTDPVVIVSESMAQRVWPGREAIGQCLRLGADGDCMRVVGVAANVAHTGLDADSTMQYWLPHAQRAADDDESAFGFLARVRGEPEDAVAAIRQAVQSVLPGDAYPNVRPMRELTDPRLRSWRLGATMFVAFGALSLAIAAVGLYGVIAYHVQQRRHELGVRQALGARAADLHRAVLGEGLRVVAAGLAVGALVSLAAARWLEPLLYRVSPRDPLTYGAVVVVLLAAAVLACLGPARRAARVSPSEALRAE